MVLFARVSRPEASVAGPLRQIVSEIDPAVGIGFNAPYREMMGLALIPARIAALFASVFGAVGLLLAALGLYGVLAYTVSQRTREIGIRVALGAAPGRVRRVVIQEGVRLSGFGVAIGFAFALAVTHLMRGLLFGLSPMDPVTFAAIALILLGTAVAASAVPAVRATRISPIEALRSE